MSLYSASTPPVTTSISTAERLPRDVTPHLVQRDLMCFKMNEISGIQAPVSDIRE
ncbi:hypothetical protein Bpfe_001884, partial [Biomphalaria pfeifferi]